MFNFINRIFNKSIFISYSLIILWMLVIFSFSSMNADDSGALSQSTTQTAIENTLNITNGVGITDKHPNENKISEVVEFFDIFVRKSAHMFLYFVLTLLVLWTLSEKSIKSRIAIALAFCFFYACTDEFHQVFVPGRTGKFLDCLIDTLGGAIACLLFLVFLKIKRVKNKGKL